MRPIDFRLHGCLPSTAVQNRSAGSWGLILKGLAAAWMLGGLGCVVIQPAPVSAPPAVENTPNWSVEPDISMPKATPQPSASRAHVPPPIPAQASMPRVVEPASLGAAKASVPIPASVPAAMPAAPAPAAMASPVDGMGPVDVIDFGSMASNRDVVVQRSQEETSSAMAAPMPAVAVAVEAPMPASAALSGATSRAQAPGTSIFDSSSPSVPSVPSVPSEPDTAAAAAMTSLSPESAEPKMTAGERAAAVTRGVGRFFTGAGRWIDQNLFYPPRQPR